MTNRNIILNELKDLESFLGNYNPQNIYTVPNGYFEGLPTQILDRIKALEATNTKDELKYLSPLLSHVSKEMPYTVPAGFFQNLSEEVLKNINGHGGYQTSEEEIESLSPLLSRLKNKKTYSAPAGYFEKLAAKAQKKETKVISITRRKWYRLAVAAVVIGIVAIGGLLFIKSRQVNPVDNPQAWIEMNVKKVNKDKIDEFVSLANDDSSEKVDDQSDAAKKAEIKELMKDVSEKEIEAFLNDAVALESNTGTDGLMNE